MLGEEPLILSVSAQFGVVFGECGKAWEDRIARTGGGLVKRRLGEGNAVACCWDSLAFAQVGDRSANVVGIVAKAIEIDADFKVVAAVPFAWTQEEVGGDLPAIRAGMGREVEVAAGGFRRDEVGLQAA